VLFKPNLGDATRIEIPFLCKVSKTVAELKVFLALFLDIASNEEGKQTNLR